MRDRGHAQLCERSRTWASLRADGELSDFEGTLLDAHVARCPHCSRFERDVHALTTKLRQASPELLERRLDLPRRRGGLRRVRLVAAAAAVATAVGLGGLTDTHSTSSSTVQGLYGPPAAQVIAARETVGRVLPQSRVIPNR